jgi:hypothetical protein
MPQAGRIMVTGGASEGGASSRAGTLQRTMATAMLPRWTARANPQNVAAAQSANVIVND